MMMKFHDQNRQKGLERHKPVILSAAKDLGAGLMRSFAALRMTIPALVVKLHHHARTLTSTLCVGMVRLDATI